jgi:hypothetical protein
MEGDHQMDLKKRMKKPKQIDIEDLTEDRVESFDSFIDWFKYFKIFRVTEDEIYILDQQTNKICILNKMQYVDSIFNLPFKDIPINKIIQHNNIFDSNSNRRRLDVGFVQPMPEEVKGINVM